MQNSKFLQITPLGSADPNNAQLASNYLKVGKTNDAGFDPANREGVSQNINLKVGSPTSIKDIWDSSPNSPIIQGFQNLFSDPKHAENYNHPEIQNHLFDVDNTVKGTAGVFRTPQQGLSSFGSDIDGKPLHTFDAIRNSDDFTLGKNRLYTAGSVLQQLGSFEHPDDSDKFAKITHLSGDPNFMGRIEGLKSQGDTKGAVNTILTEFGHPELDNIHGSEDHKRSSALAFAAYNYAENAEKFSPSQKSLALSTMGMMSYKFKDGTDLSSKALIKDENGKTAFSTGDAMALAGSGIDVFSLQKNWDQIDVLQRLTYGKGTASQMAATGQRMGLLGDPAMGGVSVKQTDAQLGQAGFTSVPSAGNGAITGDGRALPQGYEVVGAGQKPNQVVAVPQGLSHTTATINGSTEIRSLNAADGVRKASTGAFKVANNWLPTDKNTLNSRGTSFASGLGQSGAMNDPYLRSSVAATSVYGNTVNTKVSKEDVGTIRRAAENATLNVASAGLSGKVQQADQLLTGGKLEAAREKIQGADPLLMGEDKLGAAVLNKVLPAIEGGFGGKSDEQQSRDQMRKLGVTNGLVNGSDFTVQLSDGTTADVGVDGHGGQHEFRDPSKSQGENRSLNSYDVDYTNNLDYSANMMTSALSRMMAGGKGTSIDQFGGQLGNAALGKVGFGQDMSEENFNYVRDNVRGFYFKQGVQTKEDAYALINQMAGTGRITEVDQVAMQQGVNMVFDDNAYDTANVLLSGRDKGIQVAAQIPKAPGPNFLGGGPKPVPRPVAQPEGNDGVIPSVTPYPLVFQAGSYGGNSNTSAFTNSIIKYHDTVLNKKSSPVRISR